MLSGQTTFSRRIFSLLGAGFGVIVLIAAASIWLNGRSGSFADRSLESQALRTAATELLGAAQNAETGQRGFLLTGDRSYLAPYEQAQRDLPGLIARLHEFSSKGLSAEEASAIETLLAERMQIIDSSISAAKAGDMSAARDVVMTGKGKAVMDDLREQIGNLIAKEEARFARLSGEFATTRKWLLGVNLVSLLLIMGAAVASLYIARAYIAELDTARSELERANTRLEDIVEERTSEIRQANDEIQRFAYIVSHDLRAPLVNVMGFTSELEAIGNILRRQYEQASPEARDLVSDEAKAALEVDLPEAIGFIRASTAKMDRLINAILKLSREGRRVLTPVRLDMDELVNGIVESLRHQTTTANAEIEVADLPDLASDRTVIEQIFSNLIENALKYLDPARPGRIEIRGRRSGAFFDYEIEDNGRGIAAGDFERIFELFRRSGRQDVPGEGVGLAFVRANVRRLGGSIDVASELGKGTKFTVRFPVTMKTKES